MKLLIARAYIPRYKAQGFYARIIKKVSLEVMNYDDLVGAIVSVEVAECWGLQPDCLYSSIDFKKELTELWKRLCGGELDSVWITFNQKPGMVFVSPQVWERHKSSLLVK